MNLFVPVAVAFALLLAPSARADEPCLGFKWDVTHEHALFLGQATAVTAGKTADGAPMLSPDTLYALALSPQEDVAFAVAPAKKMLADGASAGLVHLRVTKTGSYRISVDTPFWIDVVNAGAMVPSTDFNGAHDCDAPRKIVVYDLPADKDLVLQLSGATEPKVRIALTAVAKPAK